MRRNAGFTLIEILVVIAIIAGLAGTVSLMILQATKSRMKNDTKSRLSSIAGALEQMRGPEKMGRYPPTRPEDLTAGGGPIGKQLGNLNDTNCGIESVYIAARLKGINIAIPGFEADGSIVNLDNDKATAPVPDMASAELYEYVDAWGNPFVYFNARDYKDVKKVERYVLKDGKEIKVAPRKLANGEYSSPDTFQLFSLGPDGQAGTDDDEHYPQ